MLALSCMRLEIRRNHEERRCLQARRDRLPEFNRSRDHDAVDRRGDDGLLQIHLGLRDRCPRLRHLRRSRPLPVLRSAALRDVGSFEVGRGYQLARLRARAPERA